MPLSGRGSVYLQLRGHNETYPHAGKSQQVDYDAVIVTPKREHQILVEILEELVSSLDPLVLQKVDSADKKRHAGHDGEGKGGAETDHKVGDADLGRSAGGGVLFLKGEKEVVEDGKCADD